MTDFIISADNKRPKNLDSYAEAVKQHLQVATCATRNIKLIVWCHANAPHSAWQSREKNSEGESLFYYIMVKELDILNVVCEPFITSVIKEIIDTTMCRIQETEF